MPVGFRSYWNNIKSSVKTLRKGLAVTKKHIKQARRQRMPLEPARASYFEQQDGIFTIQYPKEQMPVPDNGRYKLHNEIDDCIVCDKCAKICPVNCIDIEPVRAVEAFGKTSDGTSKRIYPAKFDIDMAKCCFCGLCTTVCPTECLTMTKEFDFSVYDFAEHNVPFANMTPLEILEKKKELEEFTRKKASAKIGVTGNKPVIRPAIKPRPAAGVVKPMDGPQAAGTESNKPKVIIKPKIQVNKLEETKERPKVKSTGRPKVQITKTKEANETTKTKPLVRPKVQIKKEARNQNKPESLKSQRPIVRPKVPKGKANNLDDAS